jgi:hypothetical protein
MAPQIIDFLVVFAIGALVGGVEVLSRYKDAPFKVALSRPGLIYIGMNGLVSLLALLTVRLFGWTFTDNPQTSAEIIRWTQVCVAGLAAMTLFRSSLFNFHLADQDISIGPNAILQILLVAVDKEVDRLRGKERARIVEEAMDGIAFNEAVLNLPTVAIALMQNLSREDQDEILDSVKALNSEEAKNMPERTKTMSLGLTIMNVVGEDILKAAIDVVNLDENRKKAAEKQKNPVAEPLIEAVSAVIGEIQPKPPAPPENVDPLKEKLREKLKASPDDQAGP